MHVHVQASNGEAKFWLEPRIELAQNYGLNTRQVNKLLRTYPRIVGDWLILRSLRSKMCLSPSRQTVLG
jgi:hypothetical protein